jgi:hypothetical protein
MRRRTFNLGALAAASTGGDIHIPDRVGQSAIRLSPGGGSDMTMPLQAAIEEAAERNRPLYLQNGIFPVRPNFLRLRSGVTIIGAPGATLQVAGKETPDCAILRGARLHNVQIQGIAFDAKDDRTWALDFASCSGVHVAGNVAKCCSLVRFSAGPGLRYNRVTKADCCRDVSVEGNVLDGPAHRQAVGGILLSYTLGAVVRHNHIRRHGHGIWWYGGDAGKIPGEGSKMSPRWVQDVLIEGNDIADISSTAANSGGGIWGGKGERIRVVRNTVADCRDLEIDFEGCVDCEAVENVVTSSKSNASLATFFFCSDIRFIRNRVVRTDGGKIFGIFNAPQQYVETGPCIFEENDFQSPAKIAFLGASSAVLGFSFRRNRLSNVRIERSAYAVVGQEYRDNHIEFSITSPDPFDALYSSAGGSVPGTPTRNLVIGNVVTSTVGQPPGSRAIVVEDSDYNVDCRTEVSANQTSGFPVDIVYKAGADNGVPKTAIIDNNIIEHVIDREEAGKSVGKSTVLLNQNRRKADGRLLNYPDRIPTAGLWNAGQRVIFDQAEPDGSIGAICTQTGTPGEWRKFNREPS